MSDDLRHLGPKVAAQLAGDIYKDLAQPTAQRVGHALETISKIALSPVALLDWSFEQTREWLKNKILKRLESIPPEFVASPSLNIAVPVITHVAMSHDSPELRDLYAELLLKAMDTRTKHSVHPAYVHLIEQLSSEEALVLVGLHELARDDLFKEEVTPYSHGHNPSIEDQFLDHCKRIGVLHPEQGQLWLDNFLRLRLVSLSSYTDTEYVPEEFFRDGNHGPRVETTETRYLSFTTFGKGFVEACAPVQNCP